MRIAYISSNWFADTDLSLLHSAQQIMDIDYYLVINNGRSVSVINLQKAYPKSGLFKSDIYPELQVFKDCIDLNKTYIVNSNAKHAISKEAISPYVQLYKALKKGHYDVIHISNHFYFNNFFLYRFRKRMIYTVHDPINHSGYNNRLGIFAKKVCIKLIPNLLILNKAQEEPFRKEYALRNKRIFFSRFSQCIAYRYIPCNQSEINDYILFFGRIDAYKGLDYLFPAMQKVHEEFPNTTLVVAGRGNYIFDIEAYKKLPYFKIINQFIDNPTLVSLIKGSKFVVAPYIDATQSGVVMTTFAFNKPCVVTNVGGLPEMVEDNVTGRVVEPKDVDALADTICEILRNPKLLDFYSSNIETQFSYGDKSWDVIAKELKESYQTIINNQ